MALHFPLMVNNEMVGRFVARRRDLTIPADRICTYDVTVELRGRERTAVVRHNYDTGAFSLVQAGLVAVNLMLDGPPDLEPYVLHRGKVRTLYRVPAPAMPVFTIKAQDKLAVRAIQAYLGLCLELGLDEQAEQVQLALEEVEAWRDANPDRVRFPDHQHVPAGPAAAVDAPGSHVTPDGLGIGDPS